MILLISYYFLHETAEKDKIQSLLIRYVRLWSRFYWNGQISRAAKGRESL